MQIQGRPLRRTPLAFLRIFSITTLSTFRLFVIEDSRKKQRPPTLGAPPRGPHGQVLVRGEEPRDAFVFVARVGQHSERVREVCMPQPDSSRSRAKLRGEESACDFFLGSALDAKPLWAALYENLRDAFFPQRLPPLELTSKPIPVPDRMAARTNPWAVGTATAVNGGILALAFLLGMKAAINHLSPPPIGSHVNISDLHLFAPAPARSADGGSGGGDHDLIAPSEGRNPKFASTPIAPPMVPLIQQPKLPAESAINIRLPDDSSMPNIGVHGSVNVTLVSNGPGSRSGVGWGANGGDGPGSGNRGWGPGSGDGVYSVNERGVIAPTLISAPEAEFSDEARRQKYQGVCMVALIVDTHGNPQNVHVIRALGMGLDEKAMEAIRQYRFKPGSKDGKPVPVQMNVRVDFRLF